MASAQILTNGKALYAYNGTEWVPLNTTGNLVNSTRWQKVMTGGETSLSGNDDSGESLIYTPGYEQVYLNGVLLARDADYTATTGTTITGLTALTAGHIVEIIAYNNINVGNTYTQGQIDNKIANTFTRWIDTLSASATVLSGLDDNSTTLSYTPGLEQVYVNGILLLPSEYTATSGSSVVLSEAAVENDVIQIYTLKNFRVPNTYTIGQTDDQFLTKTSASAEYIPDSIVDAKGDLLAGTAADTVGRLAVGVDTAFLRPDSTASTGLKWDNDAWTSYTPTITNLTLGNGVLVAKYKKIGKTVFVEARVVFGSTTSLTGSPIFYLPSNQSLPLNGRANVVILDSGANYFKGMSADVSVNYFYIYAELASGSYVSYASISSTVPMTWTTNDTISISFFYEEA
jgi:hypothetical protein